METEIFFRTSAQLPFFLLFFSPHFEKFNSYLDFEFISLSFFQYIYEFGNYFQRLLPLDC